MSTLQRELTEKRGKLFIGTQVVLLLLAIGILFFVSIWLGIGSSLWELNMVLPVLAIAIVLLSAWIGLRKENPVTGKKNQVHRFIKTIYYASIITFLIFIALVILSRDLEAVAVTSFLMSTTFYMILGITAAIALLFSLAGKVQFMTWEKTHLGRDFFFMGVAIWFVFGMTAYLSFTQGIDFESVEMLGVPFAAAEINWQPLSYFGEAFVKGVAGFIEGNFFFTFLLGFLVTLGVTNLLPPETEMAKRLFVAVILALIFAFIIYLIHTSLHDFSQKDVLFYIGIFFFAGALTTLYWGTAFSFIMAHGLLDFMKALFNTGDAGMSAIAWMTFLIVSIIAIIGFFAWRLGGITNLNQPITLKRVIG